MSPPPSSGPPSLRAVPTGPDAGPRPVRGKAKVRKARPLSRLPDEPQEGQGRPWQAIFNTLSEVVAVPGGQPRTRQDNIVQLVRAGIPPVVAARSQGIAESVWRHWIALAEAAIREWGHVGAVQTLRYGPILRLMDAIDAARAEGVATVGLAWASAAMRSPQAARELLAVMAPEHYGRRTVVERDDDLPAPPVVQSGLEPTPVRVFLPAEVPLLAAGPAAAPSSASSSAPQSARVPARPSGPRLVLDEDVIDVEGREVG